MSKIVSTIRILNTRNKAHIVNAIFLGKRYFLSEAYHCETAWSKRLNAPILQNVNLDELYHALDKKFNRDGKASAIDIDLFANAVKDESHADELEDLIHKLRLSCNTTNTLSSTPHAVIRYYLNIEQYESLLRLLNDRLNYGIFADNYCLCLILDTLLKKNKISEAARVSAIHMLQEDWSDRLVSSLALLACHLYVQNPAPWQEEVKEDDTEEEIKVRVKYLRNPFFDDHFDLRDPQLLVGKTLATIGATMPDAVGQTYRLVGLGLYKKWEKAISFLKALPSTAVKPGVFKSGIKVFEETYGAELNDENDPEAKVRNTLMNLLKEIDNLGLVTNDDLHAAVISKVEQAVSEQEQNIINMQHTTYKEWENLRERLLNEQLEEQRRLQRLTVIAQEKEQLIEKEKELFFFDNEDKIDLLIETHMAKQKEIESKETTKKKSKGAANDDEYIPPEVR